MNNLESAKAWFDGQLHDNSLIAQTLDNAQFLDIQQQARHALTSVKVPEYKQEAWRYTDFKSLYQNRYISAAENKPEQAGLAFDDWIYPATQSYRLVMLNGQFSADLSSLPAATQELTIAGLNEISAEQVKRAREYLAEDNAYSNDVFDMMNRAMLQDGYYICIGKGVAVQKPIEIVHLVTHSASQILAQPRSVIVLESCAEATIIERFTASSKASYFHNSLLRVELEANAQLQHIRLQQESTLSHHLSRMLVNQQADSRYQLMNIATGAKWGRSELRVKLQGEQAECQMQGLYTVADDQYNDLHLDVSHLAAHCQSKLNFNGILLGAGHGVFDGRILVDKVAQKTDAQMSNHNLMLSEQAEIDTKPVLEIYADDVKCSHGATVGSIDPEQLFYCQSRGLDRQQAVRLLCQGFASRIIKNLHDTQLLEYVQNNVMGLLQQQEIQA